MKILLTGGTGFIGKRVLDLLLADPKVTEVHAVSRTLRSHPHPKVHVHGIDLSDASSVDALGFLDGTFHRVIHLAGLYDFNASMQDNYAQNVLPILHLISRIKYLSRPVPLVVASTFAVSIGQDFLEEGPLKKLPSSDQPYSYTKALAEQSLVESGLPAFVIRLGIVVGDSKGGEIEKIDGPYYLMRFIDSLKKSPAHGLFKSLGFPIPANREAFVPIVPVDSVAEVFYRSIYKSIETQRFFSVFESASCKADTLVEDLFKELDSGYIPRFMESVPAQLLRVQKFLTRIPEPVFAFSRSKTKFTNKEFESEFSDLRIPPFATYKKQFFAGFKRYQRGGAR